jgi:hypothetical protein
MKLAILGPLKRIWGIQNVELGVPFTASHHSYVGVSDEIAQTILDGMVANPPIIYFFNDGELSTSIKFKPLP